MKRSRKTKVSFLNCINTVVQEMMREWEADGEEDKFQEDFMKEWGKQWQADETETKAEVIPFEAKNEYMEKEQRVEMAKELVEEGRS